MVLARVLSKFLESDAFDRVLKSVLEIEESRLVAEYAKAPQEPKTLEQITVDKEHYIEKISAFSGDFKVGQILNQSIPAPTS